LAAIVQHGLKGSSYETKLDEHGSFDIAVVSADTGRILVFLRGTGYYTLINGSGNATFKALPPGSYIVQAGRLKTTVPGGKGHIETLSQSTDLVIKSGERATIPTLVIP
jgi:hypothetical protein